MPETEAEQTGTETTAPTIEETAATMGWKSDYDGPGKIDPQEFINRKPLFDKIKAQNRELKEVKKLVEGMSNTFKATSEAQYKKGISDAETRMKDAKAAYDIDAFEIAQKDKIQLENQQAATVAPASEPPEVTEFCARNEWFEKNPAMRTDALEYRETFLKRNPGAHIADVLKYIEAKIKRDYPDEFEATPRKVGASAVEGAVAHSNTDPLSKLKASMSGEEKRIMKMFVGDGKLTEKEYLESYSTVRER